MAVKLEYALQAQNSYVKGEPVIVGFSIKNLSSTDVWILKWYTPLEGIKGRIFQVTCDGVDIPYEGMLMKRGNPERGDYIRIRQGGSARADFDLSSVYSVPVCKTCIVKFKGRIHDVIVDEREIPRTSDKHLFVDVPGNVVSFSLVPK